MKKYKSLKNIIFILLSILLIFGNSNISKAEEPLQIFLDGYEAENGMLKLYVNHNREGDFSVSNNNIKVIFGNNQMITQKISRFSDSKVPISFKCVVDVSGSMSQERIDEAKAIIKDLANNKNPEDSIAITALGDELIKSEYLTDPSQIIEKADILTLTNEDTNLYYAIVQEINGMQTSDEVKGKKCLIIFSDGADDKATGITREEAENCVKDSHIPVFTVGLLKNKDNSNSKEMAKVLGSFARLSSGGENYVPALENENIDTIADSILGILNRSFVFEESLENIDVSGKEVVLKVSVSNGSGETAEDSINVPESDILIIREEQKKAEIQEESVIVEKEEPSVTDENEPVKKKTTFGLQQNEIFIGLGIILVFVMLLILFVVIRRKKLNKDNKYIEDKEDNKHNEAENEFLDEGLEEVMEINRTIGENPNSEYLSKQETNLSKHQSVDKIYRIALIRLGGNEEKKYSIELFDTYTIGRSSTCSKLSISKDTALSSLHCTLISENGKIFIRDEKSMNGTFINGVPVFGNYALNQDDVILMGSYEYRISWE